MTGRISTGSGNTYSRFLSVGGYRPAQVVTNEDICQHIDSTDEWIRERSGIVTRRFAAPDESVVDMATSAASKALAASGIEPADVDLVLLATCTHPFQTPGGSSQVQDRIGAVKAGAMDINAACAGFCYALSVAADAVRVGTARNVVVVGAEKLSDWVDWTDRRSAILFADGAGAAVVGAGETGQTTGIGPVVWGSDGTRAGLIDIPVGGKLRLDGPAVFRWATTSLADVARSACVAAGI